MCKVSGTSPEMSIMFICSRSGPADRPRSDGSHHSEHNHAAQSAVRAFASNWRVWSGVWAATVSRSKTLLYSSMSDRLSR